MRGTLQNMGDCELPEGWSCEGSIKWSDLGAGDWVFHSGSFELREC